MRRVTHLALLAAAVATISLTSIGAGRTQDIKLGFAGALSGPASFVGIEIKRGAEIAIDEINAKGGVKGHKLVLISRDDEHNPVKTVAQYRELVEREKVVGILGATNSASMLAVAPIVNDTLKVPVICPATDATEITENEAQKQGRDNYLFRVGMYGTGQANFHGRHYGQEIRPPKGRVAHLDRRLGRDWPWRIATASEGEWTFASRG